MATDGSAAACSVMSEKLVKALRRVMAKRDARVQLLALTVRTCVGGDFSPWPLVPNCMQAAVPGHTSHITHHTGCPAQPLLNQFVLCIALHTMGSIHAIPCPPCWWIPAPGDMRQELPAGHLCRPGSFRALAGACRDGG